jgi:hypothetical protein
MDTALEWDETRWAQALLERYFSTAFADEPVTFCVDDDELASIHGSPAAEAVVSLTRTVQRRVMPGYRFERVAGRARTWQTESFVGPPPSLPLLAIAVLAATRMVVHEQGGAPNYYRAFRHLLDPDDTRPGEPPGYGDTIPWLWEQLARWLGTELEGQRGIPTITRHDHFTNIGYALQQAVLRTSDRRRLQRFLMTIGYEPGEEVVPSELRRALAIYARRLGPAGSRLLRIATDGSLEVYADDLPRRIAEGWDGRLHDPRTGVPELTLRVMLEPRPWRAGLVVTRSDDDPDEMVLELEGDAIDLRSEGSFFTPAPLPLDVEAALEHGVELSGGTRAAAYDPVPVVPLAWDDGLAAWVSSGRIAYGEPYVLLVAPPARAAVQQWIVAELGEATIDQGASTALPAGWTVYRSLRLETRPGQQPPPPIANLLRSAGGGRTRLVGGLDLPDLPRTYLVDGLPVLAFPAHAAHPGFRLLTAGHPPLELRAIDGQYPLNLLDLRPATYAIEHDHGQIELDVLEGMAESPGSRVGSVVSSRADGRTCRGLIASFPSPPRPHVVPVIGSETSAVLGPDPDDVAIVDVPRWLEDIAGPLAWASTDVWCRFPPVWCIELRGSASVAHHIADHDPVRPGADTQWGRLINRAVLAPRDAHASVLWAAYQRAAAP